MRENVKKKKKKLMYLLITLKMTETNERSLYILEKEGK